MLGQLDARQLRFAVTVVAQGKHIFGGPVAPVGVQGVLRAQTRLAAAQLDARCDNLAAATGQVESGEARFRRASLFQQFCLSAWLRFPWSGVHAILVLGILLVGVAGFRCLASRDRRSRCPVSPVCASASCSLPSSGCRGWSGAKSSVRTVMYALRFTLCVVRRMFLGRYFGILGLLGLAAVLGLLLWLTGWDRGRHLRAKLSRVSLGAPSGALFSGCGSMRHWSPRLPCGATLHSPDAARCVGAAFAVAGKSLGAVIQYLESGADGDVEFHARFNRWSDDQWVLPRYVPGSTGATGPCMTFSPVP